MRNAGPVRARVLPVSRPIAQRRAASARSHPSHAHSPLAYAGSLSRSHNSFGDGEVIRGTVSSRSPVSALCASSANA